MSTFFTIAPCPACFIFDPCPACAYALRRLEAQRRFPGAKVGGSSPIAGPGEWSMTVVGTKEFCDKVEAFAESLRSGQ